MVLLPLALFRVPIIEPPNYPQIWRFVGTVVGIHGVGRAGATTDPVRSWPVVLAGMVGKFLGPIGFLSTVNAPEAGVVVSTSEAVANNPAGQTHHADVVDGQARIRYAFCLKY